MPSQDPRDVLAKLVKEYQARPQEEPESLPRVMSLFSPELEYQVRPDISPEDAAEVLVKEFENQGLLPSLQDYLNNPPEDLFLEGLLSDLAQHGSLD